VLRAWAIAKRDLEDALRNSTFLLILIGPVVCSILFFHLSSDDDFGKPKLGVVGSRQEGLGLVLSTSDSLLIHSFPSASVAQEALDSGAVDGYVQLDSQLANSILIDEFPSLTLYVIETDSLRTRLLERALESAARTVAGQEVPLDLQLEGQISRKGDADWSKGMLPSWLVFTAMSGLMFCSASVIEEKDHRTMLGVLTAPVSMVELWVGKVSSGFILAYLSTLAVLLGNGIIPSAYLLLHLMAGCLAFSALGILVGLLCSNGAAANAATSTLFMVIYIPLALQEMSVIFQKVAMFTPAYYLQRGTRYLMDGLISRGLADFTVLLAFVLGFTALGLWASKNTKRILLGT
jgi:ABC-type Na+ efflux pump permease subunit